MHFMKRNLVTGALSLAFAASFLPASEAAELPSPQTLRAQLGSAPVTVEIVEPHLSTPEKPVRVRYLGYPAEAILDALLGRDWRLAGQELAFHALDGYVARLAPEQFARYRAYLVFARADGAEFVVDSIGQHEKRVPLAPYYLVWDNITAPELISQGAYGWPYQVTTVDLSASVDRILLPAGMEAFAEQADLLKEYCLSCHRVNGIGGDKYPINLATRIKTMDEETFTAWVLAPSRVKPGTTMPALARMQPQSRRENMAYALFVYLQALPAE